MNFYREKIKNLPPVLNIPKEFRNRDVEIIILPLDEPEQGRPQKPEIETDENGYPIGFFEQTAGALADDPIVRATQGEFDIKEDIL